MTTWADREAAAAAALDIPLDLFRAVLTANGIDESTADPKDADAFDAVLKGEARIGAKPIFKVRKAWSDLTSKASVDPASFTSKQLLEAIRSLQVTDAARTARRQLAQRPIRAGMPATWNDAYFVVVAGDGSGIDVAKTLEAMRLMEQGADIEPRFRSLELGGQTTPVFRLDDLSLDSELAPKLKDPLDPGSYLDPVTKVSRRFNVAVDLPAERHQVLLLAISELIKAAPRDQAEAKALVTQVAGAASIEEAARLLGPSVLARWQVAQVLPKLCRGALPAITDTPAAGTVAPTGSATISTAPTLPWRQALSDSERAMNVAQAPRDRVLKTLLAAKADQIRSAIEAAGGTPRGSTKSDLAQQLISINPPLHLFIEQILIDQDAGNIATAAFEAFTETGYPEWRNSLVTRYAVSCVTNATAAQPQGTG